LQMCVDIADRVRNHEVRARKKKMWRNLALKRRGKICN